MAGETPDASRVGKQRAKKTGKRLTHLDEKKTDKYYASGNPSVINNSPADTRGNAAAKPQANNVGFGALDERSADKKYYKERTLSGPKPVARHLAKALQAQPSARTTQAVSELTVRSGVDVNPVMDEVVRRLQNGDTNIIVTVSAASMRRARAKLDTLVTRELITEEQSRDVRFSRLADVEAPPPPVPTETVDADKADADLAIDDILSGDVTLDEGPSTVPQDMHEVDDVDDVDEVPTSQPITAPEVSDDETQSLHEEEAAEAAADPLDETAEEVADEEADVLSPEDSEDASDAADSDDADSEDESDE